MSSAWGGESVGRFKKILPLFTLRPGFYLSVAGLKNRNELETLNLKLLFCRRGGFAAACSLLLVVVQQGRQHTLGRRL